jgi:hypothetical protein
METNQEKPKNITLGYDQEIMRDKIRSSGKWFFWISILSLVNIVFLFSGVDKIFVLGMSLPFFINAIFQGIFSIPTVFGIIMNILFIGFFVLMGFLSINHYKTGFIIGLIIYFIDTLIFIVFMQWIPIAFHILALVMITRGLVSLIKLEKPEKENFV